MLDLGGQTSQFTIPESQESVEAMLDLGGVTINQFTLSMSWHKPYWA